MGGLFAVLYLCVSVWPGGVIMLPVFARSIGSCRLRGLDSWCHASRCHALWGIGWASWLLMRGGCVGRGVVHDVAQVDSGARQTRSYGADGDRQLFCGILILQIVNADESDNFFLAVW